MLTEQWQKSLAALSLGQMITMMAYSFVFPFFPLYIQTLGIQGTAAAAQWAGATIASTAISMTIAQPIWGNLSDRMGRRPMVIRSMLGGCLTLTLMGFVTSPEQLLALRFIQGAVTGTVAAGNALVAASVPRQRLGFALGLMQLAFFMGTSVGPLMGGLIADAWGFRMPFYAAGAMMLIAFVVVVLFTEERFTPPAPGAPRVGLVDQSRSLMLIGVFPILLGIMFLVQLGNNVVSPVLSLFIANLSGETGAATAAGIVLAATGAVSAVSALALGRLGDRIGHRVILPVCLAGAAVTYFPQAFVQQVWQLLLLRMGLGLFLGGLMPSANALVARVVPENKRGAGFGLSAAATSIANAIGPLSGALIASTLGIPAIFIVTGVLFSLGYMWATVGFRRHPVPVAQRTARHAAPEAALERDREIQDVAPRR